MSYIKGVKVSPGCIGCGTCAVVCPKVFEMRSISQVKGGVDLQEHEECILSAAEICPVGAIEVEIEESSGGD